jgi:hypothetical protein
MQTQLQCPLPHAAETLGIVHPLGLATQVAAAAAEVGVDAEVLAAPAKVEVLAAFAAVGVERGRVQSPLQTCAQPCKKWCRQDFPSARQLQLQPAPPRRSACHTRAQHIPLCRRRSARGAPTECGYVLLLQHSLDEREALANNGNVTRFADALLVPISI